MTALGDSHNFGRRVTLRSDGLIHKPRSTAWEKLFLGEGSPLRALVDAEAKIRGLRSPFEAFPILKFSDSADDGGGLVERLVWSPCLEYLTPDEASVIGRAAGICAWFGLSDLHSENMAIGRLPNGNIVAAPIDIEGVLHDFELLSQTLLLPGNGIDERVAGLGAVVTAISAADSQLACELCAGYVECIEFLTAIEQEIYRQLLGALPELPPSRLIFRATRDYVAVLRGDEARLQLDPPLCESERAQLARGDVPYFCRRLTDAAPLALTIDGQLVPASLPNALTAKILGSCSFLEDGTFRRRNLHPLGSTGVLQLARALDSGVEGELMSASGARLCYQSNTVIFVAAHGAVVRATRRIRRSA